MSAAARNPAPRPDAAQVAPILPAQHLDLTAADPAPTPQLSLPRCEGAGHGLEPGAWSLHRPGGFLRFHLDLAQPVPVMWTAIVAAPALGGRARCPIAIAVNGKPFVASYSDTNPRPHPVTWVIPPSMLVRGTNTIQMTLLEAATTPLLVERAGVANALLPSQAMDFAVAAPRASAQLSLPLYQGCGFRADVPAWSFLLDGGFLRFHLGLAQPTPVRWTPALAAPRVGGKANCPISIAVNGRALVERHADTDPSFHPVSWVIPADYLRTGNNQIVMTLLPDATTPLLMNRADVTG